MPKIAASRKWTSYEVYQRDSNGVHSLTPFSLALAGVSGGLPTQAITKMRMVQEIGWPAAKQQLKDDFNHHLIVRKDEVIWLLKCKPKCWRLYFYVWETGKGIVYVHATCKQQDKEDPNDETKARRVFPSTARQTGSNRG